MKFIMIHSFSLLSAAAALALCLSSALGGEEELFDVSRHGAVGDGKTLNSKALQAAIDECAGSGGGTLVIPKGVFLSGALFLKPGVNIRFLPGAVLKGSTDINDYPKVNTRIEGHFEPWRAALINGDKVDHLRITGPGTLDGSGAPFWQEFYRRRAVDHKTTNLGVERPRLTFIQNSEDVRVSGIHFKDSGFWNLHLYRCRNVEVEECRFEALHGAKPNNAPSSDGIDVDSSQDVTISKCFFSVGDDCIALKGSKGPFALQDQDSPPVERIHIRDCVFEAGGGIVTLGSEATVVRDVEVLARSGPPGFTPWLDTSTSNGFVEFSASPQFTGTAGSAAGIRLAGFWSRATTSNSPSSVAARAVLRRMRLLRSSSMPAFLSLYSSST